MISSLVLLKMGVELELELEWVLEEWLPTQEREPTSPFSRPPMSTRIKVSKTRRSSTTVCHVVLPRDTALQAGAGGLAISDAGYAFLSMHFDAKPRRDDTNMF